MNFASFNFVAFFLIVLIAADTVCRTNEWRKNLLLVASYYFYMSWDWRFAGLILTMTALNFACGAWIAASKTELQRKLYLTLSVGGSLAILGYFKYADFFIDSFNLLLRSVGIHQEIPLLHVLLPVGISFFTFQALSYCLDIYRGKLQPTHSVRDFALFIAFFPQLVAGPIVRASYFLPQLRSERRFDAEAVESGLALMIRGLIKKVALADVLGVQLVDPAFANPEAYSPAFLLVALYAYSFQVYLDFSGYTDIARGVARTLGYELPINFNRPYMAVSISDFWQRWHISMSSFFRDYLYFGLGGSKHGNVYLNLMITFIAIGVWHGAGWNFFLYGAFHGAMVCWERYQRQRRERLGLAPLEYTGWRRILQIFLIFNLVAFARILFRSGSVSGGAAYAFAMLDFSVTAFPAAWLGISMLALAVLLHFTPARWSDDWLQVYRRLPAAGQSAVMVTTTFVLVALSSGEAPFVYFQF